MNSTSKTALFFVLAVALFSTSFSIMGYYRNYSAFALQEEFQDKQLKVSNLLTRSAYLSSSEYPDATAFSRSSFAPTVQDIMPSSIPNLDKTSIDSQKDPTLNTTDIFHNSLSSRLALQKETRQEISGQYIVVLKQEANSLSTLGESDISNGNEMRAMASEIKSRGAEILNIYRHALSGYTIKVGDNPDLLRGLKEDPRVATVEQDQKVRIFSQVVPTGIERIGASPLNTNVAKTTTQAKGVGSELCER